MRKSRCSLRLFRDSCDIPGTRQLTFRLTPTLHNPRHPQAETSLMESPRPVDSVVPQGVRAFTAEYHLAILGSLRADGSPHLVPVGFTLDTQNDIVRIITIDGSQKTKNAARGGRAAVSWVDGGRWATLEGNARTTTEPDIVAAAVAAYAEKYRVPGERPDRAVLEIFVDRVLCADSLRDHI